MQVHHEQVMICPGCKRTVIVSTTGEGTSCYVPVEDDDGEYCDVCSGGGRNHRSVLQ